MSKKHAKTAPTRRFQRWPFVVAGLCGTLLYGWCRLAPDAPGTVIAFIGLSLVLVVTVPICILNLFGCPVLMTLSPLVPSAEERARRRQMRRRPLLDDEAFYQRYYAASGVPRDIPLRLRAIYAEELSMEKVVPEDRAEQFYWDLDGGELVAAVEAEFGVEFNQEEIAQFEQDGRFDWFVRQVAEKRATGAAAPEPVLSERDLIPKARHRRRIGWLIAVGLVGLWIAGLSWLLKGLEGKLPGLSIFLKTIGILMVIAALVGGQYRPRRK